MVLFQVGPDGTAWRPKRALSESDAMLRRFCSDGGLPHTVEVVLDETLHERLAAWQRRLAS